MFVMDTNAEPGQTMAVRRWLSAINKKILFLMLMEHKPSEPTFVGFFQIKYKL